MLDLDWLFLTGGYSFNLRKYPSHPKSIEKVGQQQGKRQYAHSTAQTFRLCASGCFFATQKLFFCRNTNFCKWCTTAPGTFGVFQKSQIIADHRRSSAIIGRRWGYLGHFGLIKQTLWQFLGLNL